MRKHPFNQIRFVCLLAIIVFFGQPSFADSKWTESSFEDFIDGKFLDAGSNLYVSASGRIQMITRWDFNDDGYPDILLAPGHGQTEKENSYIFLNNGLDIDSRSRIEIPGGGTRDGIIEDFNKDGWNDLVVANYHDSHYGRMDAWIYYGGPYGFSPENRTMIPAYEGTAITSGDFDGNGWLDLAIACQWQAGDDQPYGPKQSFIYWNNEEGFRRDHRLPLSFNKKGVDFVAADDLDGDGIDDLVASADGRIHFFYAKRDAFSDTSRIISLDLNSRALDIGDVNGDGYKDVAVCMSGEVAVLQGGEDGFHLDNQLRLSVYTPRDVVLSDIDGNGFDDVVVANFSTPGGGTWTDSYVFYSDNGIFSTMNPLCLPTLGASGVSAGDLNGDGFPELVFSNERITNQNQLLSYIFWNRGGRFIFNDRTQLPTQGSIANTIGDVNHDGLPDVVFFNDEGGFRDGAATAHIYWGNGTRDFSKERSLSFSTHQIFGLGHADLDDDGRMDLILCQSGFISGVGHQQNGLILYWGDGEGFNSSTYLTMETAYGGVRIADLNRDGYLDILAGGHVMDLEDQEKYGFPIFWGSPIGFQYAHRTVLHMEPQRIRGPLLMDLNRDGWLDIAGQVKDGFIKFWWGSPDGFSDESISELDLERNDHLMYIKGADFNKDGWIDLLLPLRGPPEGTEVSSLLYYGSEIGFSTDNRIELPCYVTYQNTIADFNRDGWLDIFLCSYGGEVTGNRPSLIHWGSPNGFFDRPRTELETYGSSGSEAIDYDGDGWLDLLICNHRKSGSYDIPQPHRHTCPSMLYWGSANGFSEKDRWEVLAQGPSGLNLRDLGNSYDRGLYEDYISSSYQMKAGEKPEMIAWEAQLPHGTSVQFQIRTADSEDSLNSAHWCGSKGPNTWFQKSGSKIKSSTGEWIQYRARLITRNGAATPYLTSVSIYFK